MIPLRHFMNIAVKLRHPFRTVLAAVQFDHGDFLSRKCGDRQQTRRQKSCRHISLILPSFALDRAVDPPKRIFRRLRFPCCHVAGFRVP